MGAKPSEHVLGTRFEFGFCRRGRRHYLSSNDGIQEAIMETT